MCLFCQRPTNIVERTFYEADGWFAFLDGKPITRGHVILARHPVDGARPQDLTTANLSGHDRALVAVVDIMQAHYQPKDSLFASLRGSMKHMHTHVYPIWDEEEAAWRRNNQRPGTGQLLQFLGSLEAKANESGSGKSNADLTAEARALKQVASRR